MARLQDDEVERFHATSGRVTGWMTVVLAAVVAAAGVVYLDEGFPLWLVATAVLVGVLAWAAMLRPACGCATSRLVMRNMLETIQIRLVAVEELAVRQVLAVRAADRRWVSTAVGRSVRKTMTSGRRAAGGGHGRQAGDRGEVRRLRRGAAQPARRPGADRGRHPAGFARAARAARRRTS